MSQSLWKKPEDYKEFTDFAIENGVPSSVFWSDAEHCTCFADDGESTGIAHGMYNMWKSLNK